MYTSAQAREAIGKEFAKHFGCDVKGHKLVVVGEDVLIVHADEQSRMKGVTVIADLNKTRIKKGLTAEEWARFSERVATLITKRQQSFKGVA